MRGAQVRRWSKPPIPGESAPMRATDRIPGNPSARHILVIDIGGAHVKFRIDARGPIRKFVSGPKMSAAGMTRRILELTRQLGFGAVSIGYPGHVVRGRKIGRASCRERV